MATNERLDPKDVRPVSALESARARVSAALRFSPREAVALAVLGLLVLTGAGIAYLRARPVPATAAPPVAVAPSGPSPMSGAARIVVHVVGAVKRPGVYDFDEGARVIDAVRAAGGFARGADPQAVNLARPLVDGEQVIVPRKGEGPAAAQGADAGEAPAAGNKVNINLAGVSEFDTLPGIGPVLAQRIVDYREQHGPFHSIRDLQKVSGIGPKKYESLEAYLTV